MKERKRDWADKAAARSIMRITGFPDITAGSENSLAKLFARALRQAEKRGYDRAAKLWNESLGAREVQP